jgi:predicted nucleotidyltransferase
MERVSFSTRQGRVRRLCGSFADAARLESEMNRADVLEQLAQCEPTLATRFGVTSIALFGSTVRDAARVDSDIDILVSFDGPATSERYFGVQFFLEDLLGRPVDLVTDKALRPELRPFIEREAVHV